MTKKTLRLLDANLNRLKEGIRVVEDIYRYIYDNKTVAKQLKTLRHKAKIKDYKKLLDSRDIVGDVLKKSTKTELNRTSIDSILIANFKRAEESSRVLEEFCKMISPKCSAKFCPDETIFS